MEFKGLKRVGTGKKTETSSSIMTLTGYFFVPLVCAPVASQPPLFEQSKLTFLKMAFV